MLMPCLVPAVVFLPLPGADPAPPVFALEVPAGMVACGVFLDGRSLAAEYALKCRIRFREGRWPLPAGVAEFPVDLIESLEFGPEAVPGRPVTAGVMKAAKENSGQPGLDFYSFRFEQDWEADGLPIRIRDAGGLWFEVRDGVPDTHPIRLDEERISVEQVLYAHTGEEPDVFERGIRFSSCSYADLPTWKISATFEDGWTAVLGERYRKPMAGSGPAQIVSAEVRLGGEAIVQTSYWKLVYSAEHHNVDERYWVIFDEPVEAGGIAGVRGLFVKESYWDSPRRAALLGEDLEEVRELKLLSLSKVAEGDPPPPLFRRGDANSDGSVDLSDAVCVFAHLFLGAGSVLCLAAGDVDASGDLDLTDGIAILVFLFLGGDPPKAPGLECGDDPAFPKVLGCGRGGC